MLKHMGGTAVSSSKFKSDLNQTLELLSAVNSTAYAQPQNGEMHLSSPLFQAGWFRAAKESKSRLRVISHVLNELL